MDYINAFWVGGLICALVQILMEKTKITSSTIAKMGRGEAVSLDVLGRICNVMECNIGDLVDFVKEEK